VDYLMDEVIAATVLYNLRRKNVIGGKHTSFDGLGKRFPKHLIGGVKYVARDLIKQGWLISKPTHYGLEVCLNKDRLVQIEAFIFRVIGFKF
jgi:hypothetical protein